MADIRDVCLMVRQYRLGTSLRDLGRQYGVDPKTIAARIHPHLPAEMFDKRGHRHHWYRGSKRINRYRLRKQVERAILAGALIRPQRCQSCIRFVGVDRLGRSLLVAHHDDYRKALAVRWLCRACHYAWHKTNRAKS